MEISHVLVEPRPREAVYEGPAGQLECDRKSVLLRGEQTAAPDSPPKPPPAADAASAPGMTTDTGPFPDPGGGRRPQPRWPPGQCSFSTAVLVIFLQADMGAFWQSPIRPHLRTVAVLPSHPTDSRAMSVAPQDVSVCRPRTQAPSSTGSVP